MGKCVSKDQHLRIREIDERAYIALSDEFEYYHYEVSVDGNKTFKTNDEDFIKMAVDDVRRFSISIQRMNMFGVEKYIQRVKKLSLLRKC